MGPWLMGSFGQWNQTETDVPVSNNFFIPDVFLQFICLLLNSVNVISFSLAQSDPIKQHLQYCRCDLEYSIRYFNIIQISCFRF